MKVSLLDNLLWAASFACTLALFVVLLSRKRWRQFPVFTTLVGYYILENIVGFLVMSYDQPLYTKVYWITFTFDFLLQIALIFEISRVVLQGTGTFVRDARSSFLIFGFIGAVIAAGLTIAVHPSVPKTIDAWGIRAYLFTSLVFYELFLVMMLASQRLGLVPGNHIMR